MTPREPPEHLFGDDDFDGTDLWEFLTHGEQLWDGLTGVESVQKAWNGIRGLNESDLQAVVLYRVWMLYRQLDQEERRNPPRLAARNRWPSDS
jgi:hypothetical protein